MAQLRLQDFLVWCILLLSQNISHPCSFSFACLSSRNCKTLKAHFLQLRCTSEPACASTTQFQSGKLKQKSEGAGSSSEKSVSLCNGSPRTSILLPCLRVWISGPNAAFQGPQTWHSIRMTDSKTALGTFTSRCCILQDTKTFLAWTTAHRILCYLQLKQFLRGLVRKGERGRGGGSREEDTYTPHTHIHT